MNLILAGLSGCGLAALIGWMYLRIAYWRGMYQNRSEAFTEVMNRAITSEHERTQIAAEFEFQKRTLQIIASRESVAVLTADQVQFITQAIAQLVMSQQKAPEQMN